MDFWGSWRVRAKARTMAYGTEQGSVKTPKRREFRHKLRFWPNNLFIFACLSFACLLLLPTGTQYPAGSPKLKSSEFWLKNFPKIVIILMRFWRFLASSYEGAYFGVRNRVRFCQKLKRSQNYDDFATRAAAPKIPASFLSVPFTSLIYGFLLPP